MTRLLRPFAAFAAALLTIAALAAPALASSPGYVSLDGDNVVLCGDTLDVCQTIAYDSSLSGVSCRTNNDKVRWRDMLGTIAGYPNYEQKVAWTIYNCTSGPRIIDGTKVGLFCVAAYGPSSRVCSVAYWWDNPYY